MNNHALVKSVTIRVTAEPHPLTTELADSYCQTAVAIVKTIREGPIRQDQKLALLSRIADAADFHLHRVKLESGFK